MLLGELGLLKLVVSDQVFEEVERNLQEKAPAALSAFDKFRRALNWEILPYPSRELVIEAAAHIAPKDAPILAAAMMANPQRLITLDVRHFKTEQVLSYSNLVIQTPGELLLDIRNLLAIGLATRASAEQE